MDSCRSAAAVNASIRDPRGSGRIDLADWLTDPDNSVGRTRLCQSSLDASDGRRLVRTVDNFGMQGERPTHPELLDALATEFVRGRLARQTADSQDRDVAGLRPIVALQRRDRIAIDPENRLLWRAHRRRIPAESIRDAMLFAGRDNSIVGPDSSRCRAAERWSRATAAADGKAI